MILGAVTSWAAPTISGVSGTFSGNADTTGANAVTISGSGFGTKATAKPLVWATFEADANPTALGSRTAWMEAPTNGEQSSAQYMVGANSLGSTDGWRTTNMTVLTTMTGVDYGYKVYVHYGNRNTYGDGNGNIKVFRCWEYETWALPDFWHGTGGDDATWRIVSVESDVGEGNWTVAGTIKHWGIDTNWHTYEHVIQLNSSCGAEDGYYQLMQDSATITNTGMQYDGGTTCGTPLEMVFIQTDPSNYTPAEGTTIHYDDIYIDNVWNRAFIGNESTWADSTVKSPLIPSAWSDTSITAYFHQGRFANDATAYVYVFDGSNVVSDGYQITVGEESSAGAPRVQGSFTIGGSVTFK